MGGASAGTPDPRGPAEDPAASRGLPSAVWRAGQDRRLAMIRAWLPGGPGRVLDLGCGLGLYTARLAEGGARAYGLEIDWPRAQAARRGGLRIVAAVGEALPWPDASVDGLLAHEVLEHVADDRRCLAEIARVLAPGGRALIFVPNRGWPFETHGIQWRGRYRFGNIPIVNYLPDPIRNRLASHVRVYTPGGLRRLLEGLPVRVLHQRGIFPGFDKLAARRPRLAAALRLVYRLEATPLQHFGLSQLLVIEKRRAPAPPPSAPSAAPAAGWRSRPST